MHVRNEYSNVLLPILCIDSFVKPSADPKNRVTRIFMKDDLNKCIPIVFPICAV